MVNSTSYVVIFPEEIRGAGSNSLIHTIPQPLILSLVYSKIDPLFVKKENE